VNHAPLVPKFKKPLVALKGVTWGLLNHPAVREWLGLGAFVLVNESDWLTFP